MMQWVPSRFLSYRRRANRAPLTAPRRSASAMRPTPRWSRRAACERRPMRQVRCAPKRW